ALLETERGDYDQAIRLYAHAMSVAPAYSYLPYNLGLLYERMGDLNRAARWPVAGTIADLERPGHRRPLSGPPGQGAGPFREGPRRRSRQPQRPPQSCAPTVPPRRFRPRRPIVAAQPCPGT